jgi:AraC family ethanolamine operon transcriptional activator
MPTQVISSPEAHLAAIAHSNLRVALVLRKVRTPWTISILALPGLTAQWCQGGGCSVTEGAQAPGTGAILVPLENARAMRLNGRQFDAQTIRLQLPGDEISLSSMEPHGWFKVSLPSTVLARWIGAKTMAKEPSSCFLQLPRERADALRHGLAHLGSIVQHEHGALESAATIKTTARKLTDLVRGAIGSTPTDTPLRGRQSIPRRQIIQAVTESIERQDGKYLTVADLAAAAGVSERTLRAVFQDYFGMGPLTYLKLRTLNLVHKALQGADPSVTTVTGVATQFGIWELGRLAHSYRQLFGELPSETLRRAQ